MLETMYSDGLGGRRVQAYDGLPGRFVCPYPHHGLEVSGLMYPRVQIIHPNLPSVCFPPLLKDHSTRGSLLA